MVGWSVWLTEGVSDLMEYAIYLTKCDCDAYIQSIQASTTIPMPCAYPQYASRNLNEALGQVSEEEPRDARAVAKCCDWLRGCESDTEREIRDTKNEMTRYAGRQNKKAATPPHL